MQTLATHDTIVIGAGIAGLACAHSLAGAGADVVLLDRARGVGGRCATWRLRDQPIDHGVAFLHCASAEMWASIYAMPEGERIDGWPKSVSGRGSPCQPRAFFPDAHRMALQVGLTAWPKHLAAGLSVRLQTTVTRLSFAGGAVHVHLRDGGDLRATTVVLAMAGPQMDPLLTDLAEVTDELRATQRLLRLLTSLPSLTVMAIYDRPKTPPSWDVFYPEDSTVLQTVVQDSAKRREPRFGALVMQGRPRWSRQNLDAPAEQWTRALLEETARYAGAWAKRPLEFKAQRWQHARVDAGNELSGPILVSLPRDCRIGMAGELFSPGGGVEAAFVSGRRLAERLLGKG